MEGSPDSQYRVLRSSTKELIFNVSEYFLKENASNGSLLPISNPIARTAKATNLSEKTVIEICSSFNKSIDAEFAQKELKFCSPRKKHRPAEVTKFSDSDKCVLRRTVLGFYERKEIPTLQDIREELVENVSFRGCLSLLHKALVQTGFRLAKVDGRKILVEKSDILLARVKFVREMKQLKESFHSFVYIDETWVNVNDNVGECRTDTELPQATREKPPRGKGSGMIILHAGTKYGFVDHAGLIIKEENDADYNNEMNEAVFEEWFEKQLLPNIPPSSIIVMDMASYHNTLLEALPTIAWKKEELKNWLIKKGVKSSDELPRAVLYEMTRKLSKNSKKYLVDTIAAKAGHRVVRLPPHPFQYNPIQLIWTQVKSYLSKRNNFNVSDPKSLVKEALDSVTPEDWMNAVQQTEHFLEVDAKQDRAVDDFLDSFQINSSDDSENESSN